jgi:hypothetical protein
LIMFPAPALLPGAQPPPAVLVCLFFNFNFSILYYWFFNCIFT